MMGAACGVPAVPGADADDTRTVEVMWYRPGCG
jgi:hypothetical protein